MSEATPAEAQRLLAAEFERRGWEYDLSAARTLVQVAETQGTPDPRALARAMPSGFLQRNGATRADVADAVERAFEGRPVKTEAQAATLVINDNSYTVSVGPGAQVSGNVNIGPGTQVNLDASAGKDAVLAGVATLVHAGLVDDWNAEAAQALAGVIETRADIAVEDVERVTVEAAKAAPPGRERARELLTNVATSGLGGALGTGISAGLGQILSQLPF